MASRNIKPELEKLFDGQTLSPEEATSVLGAIGRGEVDAFQIASLLTCFRMRPITGAELSGFREAMLELALPVNFSDQDTIDLCGTGGDGKDTFNISTAASFVVAGAGFKVTKHGNYGVSSGCGSSNVLEQLGYVMTNDQDKLQQDLDKGNFCYMHAPLFHPAMKEVGPVRRGIGVKTFFNILGPLLNPARPSRQITGVFHSDLIPLYQDVFEQSGAEYAVIRSDDGYDEISLTSPFRIATRQYSGSLDASEFGTAAVAPESLHGGQSIEDAAIIFVNVLSGQASSEQTNVTCANAALAIQRFEPSRSLQDCFLMARESIANGSALQMLKAVT